MDDNVLLARKQVHVYAIAHAAMNGGQYNRLGRLRCSHVVEVAPASPGLACAEDSKGA